MERQAKWYIVNTYSGAEDKVAQLIREAAEKKHMSGSFEEILIPTEEVVVLKGGERTNVDKKYLPGYILVKMHMTDDTAHLVKSIPRVAGFLGGKGRPTPVSETEIKKIVEQVRESSESPKSSVVYEIGDQIRVVDGPFASFSGFVEEIESDKWRLKVSVMIFGRATPVTLEFAQVEKV
ncbi:MAG: transcription termination/antitermination protein NusG [Holosporales bacterium]|jgi:transcriptional antiterminator NusG|nr:transcription termination/antitermination protein NusG [Holosporales bacterium]